MQTMKEKIQKLEKESIIETITNSNGTAIKFADGTMICTKSMSFQNVAITQKVGELYQSSALNLGNWAQSFIETPNTAMACVNGGWAAWIYQYTNYSTTGAGTATLLRPTSAAASTEANYRIGVLAIGRWKN